MWCDDIGNCSRARSWIRWRPYVGTIRYKGSVCSGWRALKPLLARLHEGWGSVLALEDERRHAEITKLLARDCRWRRSIENKRPGLRVRQPTLLPGRWRPVKTEAIVVDCIPEKN